MRNLLVERMRRLPSRTSARACSGVAGDSAVLPRPFAYSLVVRVSKAGFVPSPGQIHARLLQGHPSGKPRSGVSRTTSPGPGERPSPGRRSSSRLPRAKQSPGASLFAATQPRRGSRERSWLAIPVCELVLRGLPVRPPASCMPGMPGLGFLIRRSARSVIFRGCPYTPLPGSRSHRGVPTQHPPGNPSGCAGRELRDVRNLWRLTGYRLR